MNKTELFEYTRSLEKLGAEVSGELWNNPETSGNEERSAELLRRVLRENGFVLHEVRDMPHAFFAEYGAGAPVIALLGEYDALGGLSQQVCAEKKPVVEGGAGHGCGHNLLGTAPLLAALAAKKLIDSGASGTVRFYGCPEEETLRGKVVMVKNGAFDGCDAALSWHPECINANHGGGFIALDSLRFEFKGRAAHAASSPAAGRSALDAVELMNVGANYLREHIPDRARIHYNVSGDRYQPNVVPPEAGSWYFVRAPRRGQVTEITKRLIKVARGAAMMTETEVSFERVSGCCELSLTPRLVELCEENLRSAPLPEYTPAELKFAAELQRTVDPERLEDDVHLTGEKLMTAQVLTAQQMINDGSAASTDVGDVSMILPMQFFNAACWPLGCALHSWQTAAAAGSTLGVKGMLYAAQVLGGMIYDFFTSPETMAEVKESFKKVKQDYVSPLDCELE